MDEQLRRLERRFRESGLINDEAALLRYSLRSGLISEEQLVAASRMEYPAAMRVAFSTLRPFRGAGPAHLEELEDFVFNLIHISPALTYWLALDYLRQTLPIFDIQPQETLRLMHERVPHHAMEHIPDRPFSELAREFIELYQRWITAYEENNTEARAPITDRLLAEEWGVWFDAGAHFDIWQTAAFPNACHAFHQFIRAIYNAHDSGNPTVQTIKDLTLVIRGVVDAVHELSPDLGSQDHSLLHLSIWTVPPSDILYTQLHLLRLVRQQFIPRLLG